MTHHTRVPRPTAETPTADVLGTHSAAPIRLPHGPMSATRLLNLNRTIGNQAVMRLMGMTSQRVAPRIQRGQYELPVQGTQEKASLTYSNESDTPLTLGGGQRGFQVRGRVLILVHVPREGRGLGFGGILVDQFLEEFGAEQCYLEVSALDGSGLNNAELLSWYTRHGFFDTGYVNPDGKVIMTNKLASVQTEAAPAQQVEAEEKEKKRSRWESSDEEGDGEREQQRALERAQRHQEKQKKKKRRVERGPAPRQAPVAQQPRPAPQQQPVDTNANWQQMFAGYGEPSEDETIGS